jgi:uncharacterized protein YxjI
MRYQLTQKLLALGDKFVIRDESGRDVFLVDGRAFSVGKKLSFQDMSGNELAFISQRLMSLLRTYEIHRAGQLFAEVRQEFALFGKRYTVDIPGPNDYEVTGDFFGHEYDFVRQGCQVAHVSKAYFTFADTYGVDVLDGEDAVTILATAVCIDLASRRSR